MKPTINNVPVHQVADRYLEHDFEFLWRTLCEWVTLDVIDDDDEFSLPMWEAVRVPSRDWAEFDDTMMRRRFARDSRVRAKRKEVK